MQRKKTIPSLLLSAFLLVFLLDLRAVSQAQATLVVSIQPMVYFEAPSSVLWADAGDVPSLELPMTIKVRLNRGTYADLSISRTDSIPVIERDSEAGGLPRLEVEGSNGMTTLSESAVTLRRFRQSGVYHHSVVLRLPAPPKPGNYLIPLLVRLSSSDGLEASPALLTVQLQRP